MNYADDESTSIWGIVVVCLALAVGLGWCAVHFEPKESHVTHVAVDSEEMKAVKAAGFTDVVMTGWKPFACSESDLPGEGFRAKNVNGAIVTGTVCCGWVKGCVLRF